MTAVITVPASLDDITFELVFEQLAAQPADAKVIVDARHCTWASPYGLVNLLTLAQSRSERPTFLIPEDQDKVTYWARAGFFRFAAELYDVQGTIPRPRGSGDSDVLLDLTQITKSDDVHDVVERVKDKVTQIIINKLHLAARATMGITMALSESCQNIIEHAGRGGWVMAQTYQYRKRLGGRHAIVIAVSDAGVGFRRSLESSPRRPMTDRWSDGFALETAFVSGVSRFPEPGRGQGLKGIRGYVNRWDGKFTVRSGTARIGNIPPWDDDVPRIDNLPPFPGAQLQITIPEKVAA